MEGVAPTLKACSGIRIGIESGSSVRSAITDHISLFRDDCTAQLEEMLLRHDQGIDFQDADRGTMSHLRREMLLLLNDGLAGEPVAKRMRELEQEIMLACDLEIEKHIATAPFKALFPLMFLQMPSFFLLLFVPLLNEFLEGL